MSSAKCLIAALVALGAAVLVVCKPHHHHHHKHVDLKKAVNNTICPISIHIDEDVNRIPKKIKMIKCASHDWCVERHVPPNECCRHSHDHHVMSCVEMQDTVKVKYLREGVEAVEDLTVSVGCACMIEQSTEAATVGPT